MKKYFAVLMAVGNVAFGSAELTVTDPNNIPLEVIEAFNKGDKIEFSQKGDDVIAKVTPITLPKQPQDLPSDAMRMAWGGYLLSRLRFP